MNKGKSLNIRNKIQIIENLVINQIYIKFKCVNDSTYDKYKDNVRVVLDMFPFATGKMHVGHARNYIYSDVFFMKLILKGYKCIKAIGWDAFGLPAENAAIENNIKPSIWIKNNIKSFKNDLINLGLLFDWSREINTSNINYFKITQEIFIMLFENGFIKEWFYFANWDEKDKTVLANEQVKDGKGWRSGSKVVLKLIKSWFIDISSVKEYLSNNLEELEWPNKIKSIQKHWIGKHSGTVIKFKIANSKYTDNFIECMTTEPQLYNEVKFIALSINHNLAIEYILNKKYLIEELNIFIETDIMLENILGENKIKVFICSDILPNFGTGAKMFTPTHNKNDLEFALKYNIEYDNEKIEFDNILLFLENKGLICKKQFYNLTNWCISRQKCWGTPIPLLFCNYCNQYVVYRNAEIDIKRISYKTYEERCKNKIYINCSQCNNKGIVVNETLDTFIDSSWYYLRFLIESKNFDIKKAYSRLPIDLYVGGVEHAGLHLLYARIISALLAKILNQEPKCPFRKIINQGLITKLSYIENKLGNYITEEEYIKLKSTKLVSEYKVEKMSKSKKNVVNIEPTIKEFSASALRIMLLSNYPIEKEYVCDMSLIKKTQSLVEKIYILLKSMSDKIILLGKLPYLEYIKFNNYSDDIKEFLKYLDYTNEMLNLNKLNNYIAGIHVLIKITRKIIENENNIHNINYLFINLNRALYCAIPLIIDYMHYITYGTTITPISI